MISYKEIKDAMDMITEDWGANGEKVIEICFNTEVKKMDMKQFLQECTACGGNWGGMLLSGIKRLYPSVWEAIPDDMGHRAFAVICCVLTLLHIEY